MFSILLYGFVIIISLLFFLKAKNYQIPENWTNKLLAKCKSLNPDNYTFFYNKGFVDSGGISFILGIIISTILDNGEPFN